MNKELEKLHEWLCINRLSLNITKTNFVIFHSINKQKKPITILINKEAIDEVKHIKYLGVLIDSQLTFKYHTDELNKKASLNPIPGGGGVWLTPIPGGRGGGAR